MFTVSWITKSPEGTRELASEIARFAEPNEIYCLRAPLAIGKTVFAQGFAQGLGIPDIVTSPSFPILQEYDHQPPLYHFDFYRLHEDALRELAFDEYFQAGGICLIEWPERAGAILPSRSYWVSLSCADTLESRVITIAGQSAKIQEFVQIHDSKDKFCYDSRS